jgi:hypothetical protein
VTSVKLDAREDCGRGRLDDHAAVDELTDLRWITVQSGAGHPFPF